MKLVKNIVPVKRVRFTQDGYDKFKADYEKLLSERPAAVDDLRKAREMGDLSENGWYKAARANLSSIDGRLFRMKMDLKYALIIEHTKETGVDIGCSVTLTNDKRELTYQMVGDLEADPSEGKLSMLSPIGKAVAGKKEGDEVHIEVPAGKIAYTISKITWN